MSPTYEQPPLHTTTSGGEPGERWVTIWSRLPIEALPSLSDASRSVAARVVARDVGPIVVAGTVLRIVADLGCSDGARQKEACDEQRRWLGPTAPAIRRWKIDPILRILIAESPDPARP